MVFFGHYDSMATLVWSSEAFLDVLRIGQVKVRSKRLNFEIHKCEQNSVYLDQFLLRSVIVSFIFPSFI